MSRFSITLQNNLQIIKTMQDNQVDDQVDYIGKRVNNPYLSGSNDFIITNEQPALSINKIFSKSLASRYSRRLSLGLIIQEQFYFQQNNSNHPFQNISRRYQHFVPSASIHYENTVADGFQDTYHLDFNVSKDYPSFSQLVPLVDSSDLYYIRFGNPLLKEADKKEITFSWKHNSFNNSKPLNYGLDLKSGIINNSFSDSSWIDDQGRSSYYGVNMDGYKYINLNGKINRSFKFSSHQLQVYLSSVVNISSTPSYINSVKNRSDNVGSVNVLSLYYTTNNYLAINFRQQASFYRSHQKGASNSSFSSSVQSTEVGASLNLNKLAIGSNLTYNYTSTSVSSSRNFTVWNMSASYRLMKANNLELKANAMDILHQNVGIINFGSNNTLTTGTVNTLRQYFLFSIAYYPRKFGRNNNKSNDKPVDH